MNREESLALLASCEDARTQALADGADNSSADEAAKSIWNRWAEQLLAEKAALEETGRFRYIYQRDKKKSIDRAFGQNEETRNWLEKAQVDFSFLRFEKRSSENHEGESLFVVSRSLNMEGFIFPGFTSFKNCEFHCITDFTAARFEGDCRFDGALFQSEVRFNKIETMQKCFFNDVHFLGPAKFRSACFHFKTGFTGAIFAANVVFDDAQFSNYAWFEKVNFKDNASFANLVVHGKANFTSSMFANTAYFKKTVFEHDAIFRNVTFQDKTRFTDAEFKNVAAFNDCVFKGYAEFVQTTFHGFTQFQRAKFKDFAQFSAIYAERTFDMAFVVFEKHIPDFVQANFRSPPRLDNLCVPEAGFWKNLLGKSDPEDIARYRALRGLAIATHDHERERIFFKAELRCKRNTDEKLYHPKWWFSLLYDVISDFGHAVFRPLLIWTLLIPLFATGYFSYATASCSDGYFRAIYLAAKNALIVGSNREAELEKAYSCLYGVKSGIANVPWQVGYFGVTHMLLSAVFIFLFLLGLRNLFKIK